MSSFPAPFPTYPILTPDTFNNDFFTNTNEGLSLDNAYKYFLRLTGGTVSGNLNVLLDFNNSGNTYLNNLYLDNILVSSTATEINYLNGITLGIGTANKVLTLDNSSNIYGINRIGINNIDIDNTDTTPFSVSGLSDIYGLHLHSQLTGTGQNYGSAISFNHSNTGNVVPLSAIVLDKTANGFGELVFYNRNGTANLQENFRMKSNGEFKCVSLNINNVALTASATELNYLDFSPTYSLGVNEASKAVVLDASRNTTNINNLSATNFIGSNLSLSSANTNNINSSSTNTTVLTATSFTNQYDMYFRKPSTTAGQTLGIAFHITTNDVATSSAGGSIIFTRVSAGTGTLSFNTSSTERLRISETGIVSVLNTTNSTTPTTGALVVSGGLGVGGHIRLANNGRVWINSEFGFSHTNSVSGTAEVITYNNGTTGSYIGTYSSHNFGIATGGTIRIATDTSGNVNIVNHNSSTVGLRLNNTLITASGAEINYLDLTTGAGTAEFNKALVLDGTGNITGIVGLTSTNLNCTTLSLSGTAITASASELNALDFTTGGAGTAEGNKALVVNSTRDITNINSLTATNLTGLLQTANQSNITGLGTLNGLNCSGMVDFSNTTQTTNPTSGALKVAGGVGINKALWVNNNINTNGRLRSVNAGIGLEHTDNTIGLISYVNISDLVLNQGAYFGTNTNHNLIFQTNELERMRINSGGNISIGNTNNTYALDITGSCNVSGSFLVNGTALPSTGDLSKIAGISNGVVSANKAVVVDGSKNITGFGNITMNGDLLLDVGNLTVKRNILGTAGNCTIERNFTCNNEFRLKPDGFTLEWGSSVRTLVPPFHYAIGTINNNGWLLMANDNSEGIWLATSGNIGINTKSPSYRLDIDGSLNSTSFYLNGTQMTASATELNYLDFSGSYVLGVCEASKAVVLNASRNVSNINSLTTSGLITSTLTLNGTAITASASEINYLDFSGSYVLGVCEASKAVVLDASRNTSNINNISMTGSITMSGISRFLLMRNSGLTNGQNVNFVLGRSNATNEQGEITFTYSTTANASYLSLGHFGSPSILNVFQSGNVSIGNTSNAYKLDIGGSLNATSLYLNGSQILATATEINVLDGYTGTTAELNYLDLGTGAGTAEANKALVLNTDKDIAGIRKISLTGNDDFITTNNTTTNGRSTIKFVGDTINWEFGSRNSTNASFPNHFYIYGNGGQRLLIDTSGNVDIVNHNGSTVGLELGGVLITASATELNYVDVSAGAGTASKALVLDANRDINNIRRISTANISLNNATTYPTPLHCGSTAGDKIIGVFNNTTAFYGFGAQDSQLKLQTGGSAGFGFYTSSTGTALGTQQMTITATSTSILQTTASTNSTTGALIVSGGVGIAGNINLASSTLTGTNCVASLRAVQLGATTNNYGVCSLLSNSASYISPAFSASSSLIYFDSDNLTKEISFEINVANGAGTTTTNPVRMGTVSNNDLTLFTNKVERMIIRAGGTVSIKNNLLIGTSTDNASTRLISALDNTQPTGDSRYICFGREDTAGNQAEISFYYAGSDSDNNRIDFGFYGGAKMYLTKGGRLGIGTSSPSTLLHISGSVSSTVSTGQHGYLNTGGAGWDLNPITFNNSLRTSSNIYCGGTVYAFSDRRIKKDIEIIPDDYSDKFFEDITLIKHRYKHEADTTNKYLGVIAQEVLKSGYIELIAMHPNENMKKENDDDIEGFTMNVDYAKIALLCVQQIKKLKKELKEIKDFISTLEFQEE